MTVIKVENLGKRYLIGHDRKAGGAFRYESMRDSLAHSMRGIYQRMRHPLSPNRENIEQEEFWALKDINFEIKLGDRVGIIGHNGAGKTTLLKLLSRITQPTAGSIKIKGRIASLLEVGTGFHPELSGRENIYLNGAILGMKRNEIKKKFDEIVAFAEVEKFLDTPVKRYSSGMYVRLAFAVAAHLEPEILLVDEVLAVGDAAFQKKSLGKMEDVSKEGRTVLFVSHNMLAVKKLCNRSMLLKNGQVILAGNTINVLSNYVNSLSGMNSKYDYKVDNYKYGNDHIQLRKVEILKDGISDFITVWTPIKIKIKFLVLKSGLKLNLVLRLYNSDNILVFNSSSVFEQNWHGKFFPEGLFSSDCSIPDKLLNVGHYYIDITFINETSKRVLKCERVVFFEVIEHDESRPGNWYGNFPGIVRPFFEMGNKTVGEQVIITKDFVYIHFPKTGGSFTSQMLYKIYSDKDPCLLKRIIRKLKNEKPIIDIYKHGTCRDIPIRFRNKSIFSIVRNPFDRYVSLFEFGWWKNHTSDNYNIDEIKEILPNFPDINFEEFLFMTDMLYMKEFKSKNIKGNIYLGPQSRQFIYFYFKDPHWVIKDLDEKYLVDKKYKQDMYDVIFIHQENLNQELYNVLSDLGLKESKLTEILSTGKIFPIEGGRSNDSNWRDYYSPDLIRVVRERERFLFEIFPEYDIE